VPEDDYNVLRHAGAIYALGEYYVRFGGADAKAAVGRAWAHLVRHYVAPIDGDARALAVWDDDVVEGPPVHAKLGGGGLGLVAASAAETVSPGSVPRELGRGIAEGIVRMQKPDGSTYSKLTAGKGPSDAWQSLYYPGEAALGLARWHRIDPDARWLRASLAILLALAAERKNARDIPPDHWALIATAEVWPRASADERERLGHHAEQIAREMLSERRAAGHASGAAGFGSFDPDARTTPTATRLEGLTAVAPLLAARDPELAADVRRAILAGNDFLLRARVSTGRWRGAIPRALLRGPDDAARAGEIRVDYVQHALSAWLGGLGVTAQ
jgi:hypothetical protein